MTAPTDSVVEDRIRTAFEQMMPVILNERGSRDRSRTVEDASDQLTRGKTVELVVGNDRFRRTSTLVALASCVALVVGGVVLFSRRVAEVDENPTSPTPAVGDVLLLPPDPVTANELDQATPSSWSSAVQNPAGQVLGIVVSPNFRPADLPSDADVRTIGGLTVYMPVGEGPRNYFAQPNCATLNVLTPATTPPWDAAVTDLLAGMTLNAGAMSVTLPAGWKELATGPQTEEFNTAFTHTIGTSAREMRLFQARNASVAQFLSEIYRGSAVPITFGQSPAWVVHSNDSLQWNYLIWSTGTTAAMLGGQATSDADLIATAQSLVATAPAEWINRVNRALPQADPATITATTILAATIGDRSGCGTRSIRFS